MNIALFNRDSYWSWPIRCINNLVLHSQQHYYSTQQPHGWVFLLLNKVLYAYLIFIFIPTTCHQMPRFLRNLYPHLFLCQQIKSCCHFLQFRFCVLHIIRFCVPCHRMIIISVFRQTLPYVFLVLDGNRQLSLSQRLSRKHCYFIHIVGFGYVKKLNSFLFIRFDFCRGERNGGTCIDWGIDRSLQTHIGHVLCWRFSRVPSGSHSIIVYFCRFVKLIIAVLSIPNDVMVWCQVTMQGNNKMRNQTQVTKWELSMIGTWIDLFGTSPSLTLSLDRPVRPDLLFFVCPCFTMVQRRKWSKQCLSGTEEDESIRLRGGPTLSVSSNRKRSKQK